MAVLQTLSKIIEFSNYAPHGTDLNRYVNFNGSVDLPRWTLTAKM